MPIEASAHEHSLARILMLTQRILALFIGLFALGMASVYAASAHPVGTVAYILAQGVPQAYLTAWCVLACAAALVSALLMRRLLISITLLLFALSPGFQYAYATVQNITAANGNPMVILLDIQLYAVLVFLVLWELVLRLWTRESKVAS